MFQLLQGPRWLVAAAGGVGGVGPPPPGPPLPQVPQVHGPPPLPDPHAAPPLQQQQAPQIDPAAHLDLGGHGLIDNDMQEAALMLLAQVGDDYGMPDPGLLRMVMDVMDHAHGAVDAAHVAVDPAPVAVHAAPGPAPVVAPDATFARRNLQHSFRHAPDFGINGNQNNANLAQFQTAIEAHIADPQTQTIQGTYRGQPAFHHYNPDTGLNVILQQDGAYLSGWHLSAAQAHFLTTTGNLGGG